MKRFKLAFSALIVCFLATTAAIGQDLEAEDLQLIEKKVQTEDVMVDAWVGTFHNSADDIRKHFREYMKDNYSAKVDNRGKTVTVAEKVSAVNISSKRADVKLVLTQDGEFVTGGIAYVKGYDIWTNTIEFPEEMDKFKVFVHDFMEYNYTQHFNKLVEADQKEMSKTTKNVQKAQNDIKNINKRVAKNNESLMKETKEKRIAKMKAYNEQSTGMIEDLNQKISNLNGEIMNFQDRIGDNKGRMMALGGLFNEAKGSSMMVKGDDKENEKK